jgi:prenyltransferase beta subunit
MSMEETLSVKLLSALRRGKERLDKDEVKRIRTFVASQKADEGGFADKAGKCDVYYTAFGLSLAYVLDIRWDDEKLSDFKHSLKSDNLDLVHYAALKRCGLIRMLRYFGDSALLFSLITSLPANLRTSFDKISTAAFKKNVDRFAGLSTEDSKAPYVRYLWLSMLEDMGREIPQKDEIISSLADYKVKGGGYSIMRNGKFAGVTATAAALAIIGQLSGYHDNEDVLYLRDMQEKKGGFKATRLAPSPDLFSTAMALFALSLYKVEPKVSPDDFIDRLRLDSGGFVATRLDPVSDVEYTFYGLLAMGATVIN